APAARGHRRPRPRRAHDEPLRVDDGAHGREPGLRGPGGLRCDRGLRSDGSRRGALSGGARSRDGSRRSARRVRLRDRHANAHRGNREAFMTRRRIVAGRLLLLATTLATIGARDGADSSDPCTDFYAYANAGWLADNPVPAGQSRWSPRSVGRAVNESRLQTLLEDAAARGAAPAGAAERLA